MEARIKVLDFILEGMGSYQMLLSRILYEEQATP